MTLKPIPSRKKNLERFDIKWHFKNKGKIEGHNAINNKQD